MQKIRIIALIAATLMVLAACGAADDGASDSGTGTTPSETTQAQASTSTTRLDVDITPTTTKMPDVTQPPANDGAAGSPPVYEPGDDAVAFAIADLAYQLGIDEDEITLVEQEEVVWRDGSIGCPQPGFSYTQALVDGSRIVLAVDGEEYSYHQGEGRAPFWCENPAE